MSARVRAWQVIVFGLAGAVVLALIVLNLETSPVRIEFLSYTNHDGRAIALFGITNLLRHDLRGIAYAETNLAERNSSELRPVTDIVARPGRGTRPIVSTQIVWRAAEIPFTKGRRDFWLGAATNAPHNGMTIGVGDPAVPWKLALFFPPESGALNNTPRSKLAAFFRTRGWTRLSNRLQPKPRPLIVYGEELSVH